jgi:S1/P1 Nuclease
MNTQPRRTVRRITALAVGCLILCLPTMSLGWGPGGHMMVAQIAFDRLTPHAKQEVARLLAIQITRPGLSPKSKGLLASATSKSKDFVNASHWPDDLRPMPEFDCFKELHFVDTAFSDDGTALPSVPTPNAINALKDAVDTLKTSTDDNARAQALRFLIHFVGDIHQPLHSATRVRKANPEGDRGGNLVSIKIGTPKPTNLHSFWDGGLGTFPRGGPNFSPPSLSSVTAAATKVVVANPDTDPELNLNDPTNFQSWANESLKLAQDVAYKGVNNGATPSAAYRTQGAKVASKRVAWGGYRLAALLNSIWP